MWLCFSFNDIVYFMEGTNLGELRKVTMRVTFSLDGDGNVVSAVGSPTGDVDVVDLYHVLSYLSSDIRFKREYHFSSDIKKAASPSPVVLDSDNND